MIVLGLDTALQRCSAAIVDGDRVLARRAEDIERGHAERLAPMIEETFAAAGLGARDIGRVGVVVGPGGFTGVRVALSFARGLGLAAKKPVIGIHSLAALAAGVDDLGAEECAAAVVDARRDQVYAAAYDAAGAALVAPFVAAPADAAERIADALAGEPAALIGTGAALLGARAGWRVAGADPQIEPVIVARLAAAAPEPQGPPAPLYLRAPDAKPSAP